MRYGNGITNRSESYWYGFLLGDGNLARDRNRITVVLQDRDIGHLSKMKSFFRMGRIRSVPEGYHKFIVENKELANNLRAIGLQPNKTFEIGANDIPDEYTWDFLRGVFDADGCIYLDFPYASLRWHGTQSLMKGIRKRLHTMGICTPLQQVYQDGRSYNFGVSGRFNVQELSLYLWDNPIDYLQRKYGIVIELRHQNAMFPRLRGRLSNRDILDIKNMASKGTLQKEIAELYHVSPSLISRIVRGERYNQALP